MVLLGLVLVRVPGMRAEVSWRFQNAACCGVASLKETVLGSLTLLLELWVRAISSQPRTHEDMKFDAEWLNILWREGSCGLQCEPTALQPIQRHPHKSRTDIWGPWTQLKPLGVFFFKVFFLVRFLGFC